jgi:hypothetical protein
VLARRVGAAVAGRAGGKQGRVRAGWAGHKQGGGACRLGRLSGDAVLAEKKAGRRRNMEETLFA